MGNALLLVLLLHMCTCVQTQVLVTAHCFFIIVIFSHVGMHMGLGGNPYGPAGTGKTESVKALGGLFGRQVLVFNCDEV